MKSITELAKSVGYPMLVFMGTPYVSPELRRLVEAAVAQEREACAAMAEAFHRHQYDFTGDIELHEAIRARGETNEQT